MKLRCESKRDFEVRIEDGLLASRFLGLGAVLQGRTALIINTPTIERLYGASMRNFIAEQDINATVFTIQGGEPNKRMSSVESVCAAAYARSLDRHSVLVAWGGGVCSDIVSFAASMIRRGLAHVRVPTTLVGQIDAAVGIKGGVNTAESKNYLGCFYPPDSVLVDPSFLATLSQLHIRQGLAEIIKMALVRDSNLFAMLEQSGLELLVSCFQRPCSDARTVIVRSIELMLSELQQNPFEDRSLQRLVDMGHTVSPTLESKSGYELPHGEAVAVDIAFSAAIAATLQLLERSEFRRIVSLLTELGLPTDSEYLTLGNCQEAFRTTVLHRGGNLNLVVPVTIGTSDFIVDPAEVDAPVINASLLALREMIAECHIQHPMRAMTEHNVNDLEPLNM